MQIRLTVLGPRGGRACDVLVTAPAGTRLNARSVSGNITIRGIMGELTVDTISGAIRVDKAARISQARSVSGDVVLNELDTDGSVTAGTVSGTSTQLDPSAVITFATLVSQSLRIESTKSIACESPGVGPASPDTISP